MNYQIVVMDINNDYVGANMTAWIPFREPDVEYMVGRFTTAGTPPDMAQSLRLQRFAHCLLMQIPKNDPMWRGADPQAEVAALNTKGWIISVDSTHAERLLRAAIPLARNLNLAVADRNSGLYFESRDKYLVIPPSGADRWRQLDPEVEPGQSTRYSEEVVFARFVEQLDIPMTQLGFERILLDHRGRPFDYHTCSYIRSRDGVKNEFDVFLSGSGMNAEAKMSLTVASERALSLIRQAEHELEGRAWEDCHQVYKILVQNFAGQHVLEGRKVLRYNSCQWCGEVDWLAEVTLQTLPTLIAQSESISGMCELLREEMRINWRHYSIWRMLVIFAYLIWSGAQDEFEELATRRLAWCRTEKPEEVAGLIAVIDYCRATLKPDPDGKP